MLCVDLTASVPYLLRNNGLMRIFHNCPLALIIHDLLVILMRYGGLLQLHQMSEIHGIMQHVAERCSAPEVLIILRIILAPLLIIILSRTGYPFFIQHSADFQRTHSLHTHIKDTLYNWCCFGIDDRQMIRIIAPAVTVGYFAAEILASLCIDFKYSFDLLAGGTAVPFVKQ